jgi:hypothetical protein
MENFAKSSFVVVLKQTEWKERFALNNKSSKLTTKKPCKVLLIYIFLYLFDNVQHFIKECSYVPNRTSNNKNIYEVDDIKDFIEK